MRSRPGIDETVSSNYKNIDLTRLETADFANTKNASKLITSDHHTSQNSKKELTKAFSEPKDDSLEHRNDLEAKEQEKESYE